MIESLNENILDVSVGDCVEIVDEHVGNSQGTVCKIILQSDAPKVRLINGDEGHVTRIINSKQVILERIMNEGQYTENKEKFGENIMRSKVIPQTVQSFLNSNGGRLYIGVKDTGDLKERLVGLDYDFKLIKSPDRSNDKLCDLLKMQIMDSLGKYLSSEASLGSLVRIEIITVWGTQLVEIKIQKSPEPWFYKHISKNGKPQQFVIYANGKPISQRTLDDFYIRQGNKKKMLETHEEFYAYAKTHFQEQT